MTTEKRYDLRASAVRAAKKSGLVQGQFDVEQVWEEGGKSYWRFVPKSVPPVDTTTEVPVLTTPHVEVGANKGGPGTSGTNPTPTPETTTRQNVATSEVVKTSHSTIEKPTKAVWSIADEMKAANSKVTRKEIINECMRRGVAFYTARTQYQRWATSKV